ncbi:GNAT family N-acetyltransferase [Bacillus sp. FJAT-45350]|uniref:GNAT family N-acetyltransferase n=1 Tax=Bacillus sp. FJAT-45350 TaxID=2011014 RepID=UPI0027BA8812|nr:GNAT family N-acetyltransferase [Bacillus sp. FJAT-45350]
MITFKNITTIPELEQVQRLEEEVWEMAPVPIHQTLTAIKNGGIMIGAYVNDYLIGFNYSFPGFENGKTYLCSHMMGIQPQYQGRGIGRQLKLKQRNIALKQGYSKITWTYDPLESVNGYLNLTKLRGIGAVYIENCYGELNDSLNKGLPTDRFKVEWFIGSGHVEMEQPWLDEFTYSNDHSLFDNEITSEGLPKLREKEVVQLEENDHWWVPLPEKFQHIKKADPSLALDWRLKTRKAFQALLRAGFVASKIVKQRNSDVHFYLFVRKEQLLLG